ncbi:MAG: ATP-binding protein [Aliishimia sp.]
MTSHKTERPHPLDAHQMAAIFNAIDTCAVFVLGKDHTVRFCNNLATDLVGGDKQDATRWLQNTQFHAPEDRHLLTQDEAVLHQLTAGPFPSKLIAAWLDPRGGERVFECRAEHLLEHEFHVLSFRDCTQDWHQRQIVKHLPDGVPDTQLLQQISHDLGSVFGIIQIATDRVSRETLSGGATQTLQDVRDASERGIKLARALTNQNIDTRTTPKLHNIVAVTQATAALAKRIMPPSVQLDIELPDTDHFVFCKKTEFEAALVHLLTNARKAVLDTKAGAGRITLRLFAHANAMIWTIKDTGTGLPDDVLARLQDPYFTSERAMRTSGVGLNFADTFAREAGGSLTLKRGDTSGSIATLSLPEADAPSLIAPKNNTQNGGHSLTGYRILLAEGNDLGRKMLTETLRHLGAQVADIHNGKGVIHALRKQLPPDIMIIPWQLSDGMSHTVLCEHVAKLSPAPRVILLLDAHHIAPLDSTDNPVLTLRKPVELHALENAIRLVPPRDTQG